MHKRSGGRQNESIGAREQYYKLSNKAPLWKYITIKRYTYLFMASVKTIGKKNPGSNKIRKGENIYSIERFWISDSGHKKMGVLFTKKSSSSQADFSLSICTILPPVVDTS